MPWDDSRVMWITLLTMVTQSVSLAVLENTKIKLDRLIVMNVLLVATVQTQPILNVSCALREDLNVHRDHPIVIHVSREIT